ncbi:hypothetical protein FUA48_05570 [Flavobacterium alkalisoli]|uniref:DUF7832 domain-containing protein n=1 Tax=Flavobacterium alkalisoli TaxID=2602769 RepID=A0A5B9FWM4_9FLAO|nr:hypothetical protein [Flavobacterium alkalisoli]QEE49067.1 hypothetical protein FUA48_05570 [Flavobacterium alkalisoli]
MTYDRIDWHSGNNFPKQLPFENGGTHIGIFLAWIIINDMIGVIHVEDLNGLLTKVKSRSITGRAFLIEECDAKFWSEDLNDEGREFANYYYADRDGYGKYVDDYSEIFSVYETLYHVEDNWKNYDLMESMISKRYAEWKHRNEVMK